MLLLHTEVSNTFSLCGREKLSCVSYCTNLALCIRIKAEDLTSK